MALYEYRCEDCGKVSEILVRSTDETPLCAHCGSEKLEKLFSGFAVNMAPSRSSAAAAPSCSTGCCGGSCGLN